jgi:NaMN:DMB phosphoribosyltransferase
LRGWGEREGVERVVREGVGVGGEMTQALYAHMNNKRKKYSVQETLNSIAH